MTIVQLIVELQRLKEEGVSEEAPVCLYDKDGGHNWLLNKLTVLKEGETWFEECSDTIKSKATEGTILSIESEWYY
jgi:hypothetical protein